VSGLLPLSLEVVGTGISWLTMEALLVWRGVAGGRQKTRAVGRFEDLGFWEDLLFLDGSSRSMELRAGGYCRKLTGPPGWSYDPQLHECSVIPFSIDPETLLVCSGDLPHPLPNWQWVVPTPHLKHEK